MEFQKDLFDDQGKMLQMAVFEKGERDELIKIGNNMQVLQFGVLGLSLLPAIFMSRLSLFDKIEKRWKRGLTRAALVLIPVNITGAFARKFIDDNFYTMLAKYQNRYVDWKLNGDIRVFGPQVRFVNDLKF